MAIKIKQVAIDALSLCPNERALLTDTLISSLDQPNPEIDALWKTEVEKRLRDLTSGKVQAIPLSKVLANYRKRKAA